MTISCECDGPSVYHESYVSARKEHKCCECHGQIKKAELYQRISGVWDGQWGNFKSCESCADLRESLFELGFCINYGQLTEGHKIYLEEIK